MRTTLNIDDQLYRAVKVRAALENRTVTEMVDTALRTLLEEPSKEGVKSDSKEPKRIDFPSIRTRTLQGVQRKAISIDEMGELVKEAELESPFSRRLSIGKTSV